MFALVQFLWRGKGSQNVANYIYVSLYWEVSGKQLLL